MSLGKQIKRARTSLGMSQQAIGDAFGVSRSAVAQWELDRTRPDQDKLVQLASILKTSVGDLLEDSGNYETRQAVYTPDWTALLAAWELLLPDERAELLADIQRRAAHNKAVMEMHAPKAAPAAKKEIEEDAPHTVIAQDRRRAMNKWSPTYKGAERRKKDA